MTTETRQDEELYKGFKKYWATTDKSPMEPMERVAIMCFLQWLLGTYEVRRR